MMELSGIGATASILLVLGCNPYLQNFSKCFIEHGNMSVSRLEVAGFYKTGRSVKFPSFIL